jgi:hypothetical protein
VTRDISHQCTFGCANIKRSLFVDHPCMRAYTVPVLFTTVFSKMMQRCQSPQAVLASIEKKLRPARAEAPAQVLDAVVSALFQGRGYYWITRLYGSKR